MSKKVLYLQEPEISTYTSYGCLFSIMSEQLWPWIFNHFIQIRYADKWKMFAFDNHHMLLKNCPGISFYYLPQEMVVAKWGKSLKQVIIEAIDLGYYLYIFADRHFISIADSDRDRSDHNIHEILIYGYDLDKDMVLVADNFEEGRFMKAECPFAELEEGYWCLSNKYDFWTEIRFLKRNPFVECSINMKQIASGMENYLCSKPTFDLVEEQQFDYGFQALQRLFPDLRRTEFSPPKFDLRAFHLLYEHKLLMEKRLAYLMDYGYMKHDMPILDTSAALKQDYLSLRNLVIKYRFKEDDKVLSSILAKLSDNLKKEQQFLLSCLGKIKETG